MKAISGPFTKRPSSRFGKLLTIAGAALLALFAAITPAYSTTPTYIAVWSCNPCSSLTDLQTAAQQTALKQQWINYNNAIVLITSLNAPMSAFFRLKVTIKQLGGVPVYTYTATPITASSAAAGQLDNSIFARAAKFAPLQSPEITYTDEDPVIIEWIQTQVAVVGAPGITYWHNFPSIAPSVYYNVVNLQTGQSSEVFVGDTIVVQYPGGYSEQWQFLGPEAGTQQWKRVDGTLMHNGKPVTPPSTKPGSSVSGAGSVNAIDPYNPATITMINDLNFCTGVTSVTVTAGDGDGGTTSITSYGFYTFPC